MALPILHAYWLGLLLTYTSGPDLLCTAMFLTKILGNQALVIHDDGIWEK